MNRGSHVSRWLVVLVCLALTGTAAYAVPTPSGHSIAFNGVEYDYVNKTTTVSYTVISGISPAISHWVLATCDDITASHIATASETYEYKSPSNPDPKTGAVGVKFDEGYQDGEQRTVSLTLNGLWAVGEVTVTFKAANQVTETTTTGPVCETLELKPVKPILECVIDNGDGTYTVHFGYLNQNDEAVDIPVGSNNTFNQSSYNTDLPTTFEPGRTGYWPNSGFSMVVDAGDLQNNLVWTLEGPDGSRRTSTASTSSQPCSHHLFFEKSWEDGTPETIPGDYEIVAESEFGTAVCTYEDNGSGPMLVCEYDNDMPPALDNMGLWVPVGGEYTVAENNLPQGWEAESGIGTFNINNGYAKPGYDGLEKYYLHTVTNKEGHQCPLGILCPETTSWQDGDTDILTNTGSQPLTFTYFIEWVTLSGRQEFERGENITLQPGQEYEISYPPQEDWIAAGPSNVQPWAGNWDPPKATVTYEVHTTVWVAEGNYKDLCGELDCGWDRFFQTNITLKSVRPILECVEDNGDGTFTVHFGYLNENSVPIKIPHGSNNSIYKQPTYSSQLPTIFQPGRTGYWPNAAISMVVDKADLEGSLVWTLEGPDGKRRTATASTNPVQRCNYHIYFEKIWAGEMPESIPGDYVLYAESDIGTASCTFVEVNTHWEWQCSYTHNGSPTTEGLYVPSGGTYTVQEHNLPEGWLPQSGTGAPFGIMNDCLRAKPDGLEKELIHTVVNEKVIVYKPVKPILECVIENDDGTYTVHFGYLNQNEMAVTIPVGPNNKLTPNDFSGDLPTVFQPGRTGYWPNSGFSIIVDANVLQKTLVWTLEGPDGSRRTATASTGSQLCSHHIFFEKLWLEDGEEPLPEPPDDMPRDYTITASSEMGTASCVYVQSQSGWEWQCIYDNQGTNVDDNGLWVPVGTSYEVQEEYLPKGWKPVNGLGEFTIGDGYARAGHMDMVKYYLHTIVNSTKKIKTGCVDVSYSTSYSGDNVYVARIDGVPGFKSGLKQYMVWSEGDYAYLAHFANVPLGGPYTVQVTSPDYPNPGSSVYADEEISVERPAPCAAVILTEESKGCPPLLSWYEAWFSDTRSDSTLRYWNPEFYGGIADTSQFNLYDSYDPNIWEYHILSAWAADIDAFVVDWYGKDAYEQPPTAGLLDAAQSLYDQFGDMGFDFKIIIAYNEKAVGTLEDNLTFLADSVLSHPAYWGTRENSERPLYVYTTGTKLLPADFDAVAQTVLPSYVKVFWNWDHDLKGLYQDYVSGLYPWVQAHDIPFSPDGSKWGEDYLESFFSNKDIFELTGAAWPGLDDRAWTKGLDQYMSRQDTVVYDKTWEKNFVYKPDYLMVQAWNDFNRSTHLEPSKGYDYEFVEMTRNKAFLWKGQCARRIKNKGLRVPKYIFIARQVGISKEIINQALEAFFMKNYDQAIALLDTDDYEPPTDKADGSLIFVRGSESYKKGSITYGWDKAVDGDVSGFDGTTLARGTPNPSDPAWAIFRFAGDGLYQFDYLRVVSDNGTADDSSPFPRQTRRFRVHVSTTGTDPQDFSTVGTFTVKWPKEQWFELGEHVKAKYIKLELVQPANTPGGWRQIVEFEPQTDSKQGAVPAQADFTAIQQQWQTELKENYPNPFNPETTIEYTLETDAHVRLEVFDTRGRRVALLVNEPQQAGLQRISWRADHLPSGFYFYRFSAGQFHQIKKMILLK